MPAQAGFLSPVEAGDRVLLQMSISVVVGLGNPGLEYLRTRHNLGFRVVDALAQRWGVSWKDEKRFKGHLAWSEFGNRKVFVIKPQTFMNLSGESVQELMRFHRLRGNQVLAAFDEFQVPLGQLKLSTGGGDSNHNGVASLIKHCGNGFARLRLGIGPEEKTPMPLREFVLGRFSDEEEAILAARIDTFVDAIEKILRVGPRLAMNDLNRRPKKKPNANDSESEIPGELHPGHEGLHRAGGEPGGELEGGTREPECRD